MQKLLLICQYAEINPNMRKCTNDSEYAIMPNMYFTYAVMQIKNGLICRYAETPQGALLWWGGRKHPPLIRGHSMGLLLLISQLPDQIFQIRLQHHVAVNVYFSEVIIRLLLRIRGFPRIVLPMDPAICDLQPTAKAAGILSMRTNTHLGAA